MVANSLLSTFHSNWKALAVANMFSMYFYFATPFPGVSNSKNNSQWAMDTADAVSKFIGHACNARSLKKLSIFV